MGSTTRRHRRPAGHQPGRRVNPDVTGEHTALVAGLHAGDTDAFDHLYRQHVAAVTRYVAARLGGPARDGVDDCVHDAFCDALANPALIGTDVLGSLLRLAARAVTRHIQSARSQRRHLRAVYTVYEDTTRSAPAMVGRLRISHALARLSDEQRRAVHLRYLDGYPRARVAELMGRSVGAVRSLERQAVARLKADLTGDGLGDPMLAAVSARRA
jgi:RNA polymerase sigma-70 factor (ECF subfamily)